MCLRRKQRRFIASEPKAQGCKAPEPASIIAGEPSCGAVAEATNNLQAPAPTFLKLKTCQSQTKAHKII